MFSISQTEAVNRILSGVDGSIVANLTDPLNTKAIQVVRALEVATDKIQMDNEWNFNAEGPIILTANGDGRVLTPTEWLFIKFLNWTGGSVLELSVKDNYIYSSRLQSDVINGNVTVTGASRRTYDNCPAPIQNYIIEKAKVEYQALSSHFNPARSQMAMGAMEEAFIAAQKWDSAQRLNAASYGPSSRDRLRNRTNNSGWWFS